MIATVTAPVWVWTSGKAPASWYFVTIPPEISAEIKYEMLGLTRGFGAVPVTATIGETTWRTSLFPSKDMGGYLLPLKSAVRKAQGVRAGEVVTVRLEV